MNPKCSIIIRCYNEETHIGKCLEGIMHQTEKDVEIILVDSGSTDATLSIASRYPVQVVYIAPEEFSFGRALNYGARESQGEYLVMISAHCWPVYKDWLTQMATPFDDPDVAVVYGKQRGWHTTQYSEHQIFRAWFPDQSDYNQETPFCNNANCSVRRSMWEKMPYNEELTGLEDLDWAKRAMEKGYKVVYSAEAEILHVHDEPASRVLNRYRREAIAMKKIVPEERVTFLDFLRLAPKNIMADMIAAGKEKALYGNISNIIVFRTMQFWGAYLGSRQRTEVSKQVKRTFYYPSENSGEKNTIREGAIDYSSAEERI